MEVEDLFTDLADGIKLLKLLEIISSEKLGKPNSGRMRVHKIENVNKSLAFLHTKVSILWEKQKRESMRQREKMKEREKERESVVKSLRICRKCKFCKAAARGRCVLCLPH